MEVFTTLKQARDKQVIDERLYAVLEEFYRTYAEAAKLRGAAEERCAEILTQALSVTLNCVQNPPTFAPYHERLRDEYRLGVDFWKQPVDLERSALLGEESVQRMRAQLDAGENVILFGNHQTEPDPQILSLLLEDKFPRIAEEIIFVAGARVTSDPVAVPFSLGRNLLCIHSKRHLEDEPSAREQQLRHNQRTMKKMSELLGSGAQCIYVAPSGGRDRKDRDGKVAVAPFDGKSLEMFLLMAQRAKTPTHYYPLSLATYHMLPPPPTIDKELGERRIVGRGPVGAFFGQELDVAKFPGKDLKDREAKRKAKADWIWTQVDEGHSRLMQTLF